MRRNSHTIAAFGHSAMVGWVALSILLVACTAPQSSSAAPSPTASSVQASPSPPATSALEKIAAQTGDLPSGLVTCSWSGDLGGWAGNVKPTDSGYAQQMLDLWQRLQTGGATGSWVQDLSVSEDACQGFYSGSAGLVSHVSSIVIQFKDQAGATSAYSTETSGLFGPKVLGGGPTETGIATGLGPNSIVATPNNLPGITLFAAWQKDSYYLVFIGNGIALSDDRLALTGINARVP
jgi:hypothetical protein